MVVALRRYQDQSFSGEVLTHALKPSNSFVWSTSSSGIPYSSAPVHRSVPSSHHHLNVGSAPSGVPLGKHFGFFPESSKDTMLVELVSTVEAKSVDLLDAELNDDGDDG